MTATVVVLQTYIPKYRVPFFSQLREQLARDDVALTVVASGANQVQSHRQDESRPEWVQYIRPRQIDVRGRSLLLASSSHIWKTADAVITLAQGTSWDTNVALLRKRQLGIRVGLWGHILPCTSRGNRLDLWLERQQMRRADHVFAYTDQGARRAREVGVGPDAVTAVQNTIDSSALRNAVQSTDRSSVERYREQHALDPRRTFVFLGGLDASKRIAFLAASLDRVWASDRRVKVLVGGQGQEADRLEPHVSRGQVIMCGHVDESEKALMAANAVGVVMPGRVGLVAVDALTFGLPVLTTSWEFHAPEIEYLREGVTLFSSFDSPEKYAALMLDWAGRDRQEVDTSAPGWRPPLMKDMVENFRGGVHAMLNA